MHSISDRTWLWFACALYLIGFILGTFGLIKKRRDAGGLIYLFIAAGFTLQTYGLYLRGLEVHGCPIGNTFEFLQFTAWSATALYLVIGATFRLSLLGYFTSSLIAILTLVSLSVPAWDAVRVVNLFQGKVWIEFHAALALFSYGVFGLLAMTSAMYLLQLYSLQHRNLHGLFSFLPSILDLDQINLRLLTAGVIIITASLSVGSVYWLRDTSSVDLAKLLITVSVWLAYALTLGLRWGSMLLAKRLAWVCVVLFIAALISLGPINSSSKKPLPPAVAYHVL